MGTSVYYCEEQGKNILVLFGCYPKKMNGKEDEIYNILVALMNGKEEEIYNILYKKKEIDDKTPKLRTEDKKKKLKSLSYKMRKFPKDLIDDIKKKFPFLQITPKTAEQRQEQVKECNRQKRSAESEKEKEMRLKKKKEYEHEKRSVESGIEKEMRLKKQKEYEDKRYTKSTEFREKKVQEVREKRFAESEIDKDMRLKKQKEYNEKRSA